MVPLGRLTSNCPDTYTNPQTYGSTTSEYIFVSDVSTYPFEHLSPNSSRAHLAVLLLYKMRARRGPAPLPWTEGMNPGRHLYDCSPKSVNFFLGLQVHRYSRALGTQNWSSNQSTSSWRGEIWGNLGAHAGHWISKGSVLEPNDQQCCSTIGQPGATDTGRVSPPFLDR